MTEHRIAWRKSSRSDSSGSVQCVEMGRLPDRRIGVRDSKNPELRHLSLERAAMAGLLGQIKSGKFDL